MTENVAWTGITFRYLFLFFSFLFCQDDHDHLFLCLYLLFSGESCSAPGTGGRAGVDSHKKLLGNLENWLQQDATLLTMTNDVDYDQDGRCYIIYFYDGLIFIYLLSLRSVVGGAHRREAGGSRGTCRKSEGF